jgi:protein TonB
MSYARYLPASGVALGVTLGLILLMHFLIQTNLKGPGEVVEYRVPEIVMPEREIKTEYDLSKPDKPKEAEQPPPDIPKPDFDTPDATADTIAVAAPKAEKPALGGLSAMDGDMIPLAVPEPEYPRRAAQKGTEGFCVAVFTVTAQGTTRDVTLGECPDPVFERSTLKAAEKLKFKPKIVDGVAVDVPNQAYKYVYRLAN